MPGNPCPFDFRSGTETSGCRSDSNNPGWDGAKSFFASLVAPRIIREAKTLRFGARVEQVAPPVMTAPKLSIASLSRALDLVSFDVHPGCLGCPSAPAA
jgi:hypothetical protein